MGQGKDLKSHFSTMTRSFTQSVGLSILLPKHLTSQFCLMHDDAIFALVSVGPPMCADNRYAIICYGDVVPSKVAKLSKIIRIIIRASLVSNFG